MLKATQTHPTTLSLTSSPTSPLTLTNDQIAARAYERYVQRGYQHGEHLQDWLAAEAELRAELGAGTDHSTKTVRRKTANKVVRKR